MLNTTLAISNSYLIAEDKHNTEGSLTDTNIFFNIATLPRISLAQTLKLIQSTESFFTRRETQPNANDDGDSFDGNQISNRKRETNLNKNRTPKKKRKARERKKKRKESNKTDKGAKGRKNRRFNL